MGLGAQDEGPTGAIVKATTVIYLRAAETAASNRTKAAEARRPPAPKPATESRRARGRRRRLPRSAVFLALLVG